MQSLDKIQCRAHLNSPSPCGNITASQGCQTSLLVGEIRISEGHEGAPSLNRYIARAAGAALG